MSNWSMYDEGRSVGKVGRDGGVIFRDEAHQLGARITLKRDNDYVTILCHINGWTDHTRFFRTITEAVREYVAMKTELDNVMNVIISSDGKDIKVWEAISDFVRRFP